VSQEIVVIGGGLAGSEAAWQIAEQGLRVVLYEMRPQVSTPVHQTSYCAELVCSNSLGSNFPQKASGLLKEELRRLNSLLLRKADENRVPAGQALAVDREKFAQGVTEALMNHPNIRLIREEKKEIPDEITIVATGPLTSHALTEELKKHCGTYLYYYDAVAPIVTKESLNLSKLYFASRYGHGDDKAYLNAPFTKEEYEVFVHAIVGSERVPYAPHEDPKFFEACMPIEELVDRGIDTLRFGPMKPVGLPLPGTHRIPYGVIQLRQENIEGTLYNLVGFQTRMKWGEQERIFRTIPGFSEAEFIRFGVMHRNIFVNAPTLLEETLALKKKPKLFLAGQITGVEGYVEDVASGWLAGMNAVRRVKGESGLVFPRTTAIGSLMHHITHANPESFQPINANFSLFPPLDPPVKDKTLRQQQVVERARKAMEQLGSEMGCFKEERVMNV